MLEVGRADDHGVDVFGFIELVVVYAGLDVVADLFFQVGLAFFAAHFPNVGNSHDIEVHLLMVIHKCGEQSAPEPVGEAYNAYPHTVVGADDVGVALGRECHRAERRYRRLLDKVSSGFLHNIFRFLVWKVWSNIHGEGSFSVIYFRI
jgi:hypothetical protein